MKTIKKTEIAWIILAALLVLPNVCLAEGEWAQTGSHIYSTNTGHVGIGTTNPTEKLTISNGNLELKGSEGLTALKLIDGGTGDPGYAQFLYNGTVVIQVGAGNGGTYFNYGNVGIGTTHPTAALDVAGIIRANGRIQVNTSDIGFLATIDNPISPPDTAQTLISILKKNTLENGDHNQLRLGFYANDDGGGSPDKRFFTSIEAVVENPNNSTREAGLRFLTSKAGSELERMRINGNGNVGIGTANPSRKLHIVSETAYDYPLLLQAPATPAIQFVDNTAGTVGYIGGGASGFLTGGGGYGLTIRSEGYGIYFGANRSASTHMAILSSGNVGIGTTDPHSKLAVNGTITAKEVRVTEMGWSDFVFEDTYELPSLDSVESYIKKHKHLPDIPSAKKVEQQGLAVSEMLAKQMQKIEEMTLYLIELKKGNEALKAKNAELEKRLAKLEAGG